jgi:hypothetical protein
MAKAVGISPSLVQRIWRAHHLAPHRVKTFKPSRDPKFAEKLKDVVGLYIDPPGDICRLADVCPSSLNSWKAAATRD